MLQNDEITSKIAAPMRLNLGSGKDWREDFINADLVERVNPDLILDICQPLPFGEVISTRRFEDFVLSKGSMDLIIAFDVLEHLPDLVTAMKSCLDLLKMGGEMQINVPYDLSWGAWQDPTHVRAFNERSWAYYTDWYWYLGWTEARFKMIKDEYVLSPVGVEMNQNGASLESMLRTPRAVDCMRLILQKIPVE
jgi:SAM-dependent methyltransferase